MRHVAPPFLNVCKVGLYFETDAAFSRANRQFLNAPKAVKRAAAKTGELDLGETVVPIDTGLPSFPTDRDEQLLAVEAVLSTAGQPMDAAALARGFKRGGKRAEQRIAQILGILALYGRATAIGERYLGRRAA